VRPPRQVLGSHAIRIEEERLQQAKAFGRFIQKHKEGDAYKGGYWLQLRELSKMVNAECRQARELVSIV
jgi:hypothetical protein